MDKEKKKQTIKLCIAIVVFAIIIILVAAIMIRYQVEGDKNMPFNLSKIIIVSTAEGSEAEGDKKWNFNVLQNNDIYIYIDKNENYNGKDKSIKSVTLENINISKPPQKGEIKAYMPNSVEGRLFDYSEEYVIKESKLEYKGAVESNTQTLEIGNNGGNLLLSLSNVGLGVYSSDEDEEITHNGTLLKRLDISNEEIQFEVNFDLVITVENCSYRANITLQLPCGNITEEGTCSLEKTEFNDLVFKRE